ncbi:MAG: sulfate transporter [Maribacter sp.]|nr:MAG: sulfate transporter [Maribacter sp.]
MSVKNNKTKNFTKVLPKNIFAGFVVSLIALPLGLGLALASEAPPISGIIAAIVGGLVTSIIGGANITITGPGNGLVIVLLGTITTLGAGDMHQGFLYTLAAIVVSGILMVLLGFIKMGRMSDFFPASAIEGMLAAIGLGIFAKQFHIMIGHNNEKGSIISLLAQIPNGILDIFQNFDLSTVVAAIIGVVSLLIMVFYSKIRNKYFQLIPAPMWILILTIGLSYLLAALNIPYPLDGSYLINIPDNVVSNLAFPDFSKAFHFDFIEAVIAITLIASIESLLSIKAVDKLDPQSRRSDVNKDLKSLGIATALSGFLGGLNVVTVIARSSVNVNNGATNRSSDFFHALFLVIFILLFQDQLRKIPLAALAAILVYTGYKLATPKTITKIAGIGREQIIIFFVTLLTTLFTNLITGILAGIVVTFIIHAIINKNIAFFLSNLLKPNILLYKEKDEGNFYVSVKYFCTFVNFYKLKAKLDMVPEDQDVILDFSLCNFVDHTVLEGLGNYTDTFSKKGGNIEIIGLDKHETDSHHPFAIRKVLPLDKLMPIERYFTKRQKLLKSTAHDFKLSYEAQRDTQTGFLSDFVFFKNRDIPYTYNTLINGDKSYKLCDIEFTEGAFIAKETVKTTVMHILLDFDAPVFTLDKEGLLDFKYSLAGFKDIEIENHPDFNKRFFLSGEDPEAILSLFSDDLILFLESHPYHHIESNGSSLLILKKERLLSVQEIKALLYFGQQFNDLVKPAQ